MKDRNYLTEMYNATSTDDGKGGIETYESWLERQLLSRIEKLESLKSKGKTKEGILDKHISKMIGRTDLSFRNLEEIKIQPEYRTTLDAMEEYAQYYAAPRSTSGKTKEEVWEEVESYHQIEGMGDNGRLMKAIYDAMEIYSAKDGWVSGELEIHLTYDKRDGEVFCAFVDKERCEREANESGCGMQSTRLIITNP